MIYLYDGLTRVKKPDDIVRYMGSRYIQTSFQDYLNAKYSIDSKSINSDAESMFLTRLETRASPRILDVGCGTGAVARRLVEFAGVVGDLRYIGLDSDSESVEAAYVHCTAWLGRNGFTIAQNGVGNARSISAIAPGRSFELRFIRGDLFTPNPDIPTECFDVVTAHALLDILPLRSTVEILASYLKPDGMLYSAINYDGRTTFLPEYERTDFERLLLETYDRSMDDRCMNGEPVGGSRTGTLLYDVFERAGLSIIGCGSSDWSLFPFSGRFSKDERVLTQAIVEMIAEEGTRHESIETSLLDSWYRRRIREVADDRLSLIVHQTDMLGVKNRTNSSVPAES